MPVSPQTLIRFRDLADEYVSSKEVFDTAELFDLSLPDEVGGFTETERARSRVRHALRRIEYGDNRIWLRTLLERIETENSAAVSRTRFDEEEHHRRLAAFIEEVRPEIVGEGVPTDVSVGPGQEFSAKSDVRELFAEADDELFVVDPYVDPSTLDCFRDVTVSIRLLIGSQNKHIDGDFAGELESFQEEGYEIEVRRHPGLHDRHAVFNERCFLIGSSLKDAGRKQFNCTPMHDAGDAVIDVLEEYWREADEYQP